MRYQKILTLCALLMLWLPPLQAAQPGLYEAEVQAADQGREARATAMGEALTAVLLKVSGSAAVLEHEVIRSAIADAARYVQQYRYRSEPIPLAQRQAGSGGEVAAENRVLLWVSFDRNSVDNLLRHYGLTVWSAARPTTLVWLAVEQGAERVLVGANDQGLVREVLEREAQRRAIPLRLPLLDLTDQASVRAIDIWGGFVDTVAAASERYQAQAVLLGKLYPDGSNWEARWTLIYEGERYQWQHNSSDVKEVVASGVATTSDYLSQRFADSSYLGVDQLALHIDGVASMADFRRAHDYLQSLNGVEAVTLHRTEASASNFVLQIEGGREAVLQAISRGDVLVEVEAPPQQPVAPPLSTSFGSAAAEPTGQQGATAEQAPPEGSVQELEGGNTAVVEPMSAQQPGEVALQERYYRLLP